MSGSVGGAAGGVTTAPGLMCTIGLSMMIWSGVSEMLDWPQISWMPVGFRLWMRMDSCACSLTTRGKPRT